MNFYDSGVGLWSPHRSLYSTPDKLSNPGCAVSSLLQNLLVLRALIFAVYQPKKPFDAQQVTAIYLCCMSLQDL